MTHANQSPAQTNKTALRAGSSDVPVMGEAYPSTELEAEEVERKRAIERALTDFNSTMSYHHY